MPGNIRFSPSSTSIRKGSLVYNIPQIMISSARILKSHCSRRTALLFPQVQTSSQFKPTAVLGLSGHWAAVANPDTLYFTNDGLQTPAHSVNVNPPPVNAVFRATVTYLRPPTATTSIAKITVSWPARQADLTIAAGSIEMFAAVNR